ncbi:TraR/DksA C4-type zinc finger protein [Paenibacillus thailandensis]|uniref:TraR/DksA C4-type zinc finger protein n=1 Tax=Paenibacillus thailandensis TaxID=393250 RepID=A0ABW5QZG6_9BACL
MTLSPNQLQKLRRQLEQDKSAIERHLDENEHFGLADSMRDQTGELSPIDNHPGDLASEMYERGKDIALLENEDLHLSRIDAALRAMEDGTYGTCRQCGKPIPYERLEAVPDSLYCVEHSPRRELSDNRPVEEEFLNPPFGRSSMDEQSSYNGFDGEDAWQIVEQWGNSDSPAYSENRDVDSYEYVGIEGEENDGFVEPIENFVASDITGRHVYVVRGKQYDRYMESGEGEFDLVPEWAVPEEEENL